VLNRRRNVKNVISLVAGGCVASFLSIGMAQDSACFRGPNHNGTYPDATIRTNWKEKPPQVLWTKDVGYGFAGIAVAGKRALTAGYDFETRKSTLYCLNTDTGAEEWQIQYADTCGGRRRGLIGPIPTPVIDGDRVYVVAAMGALYCFDLA